MIQYIFEPEIRNMLVNFHLISGLRVGIHDTEMKILLEYPEKTLEYGGFSFCDRVRYNSPLFVQKCYECDINAFECVKATQKKYIYKCHAGFLEALIPVIAGEDIICALMIGQVKQKGLSEGQFQKITGYINNEDLGEEFTDDLRRSYEAMPRINERKFEALAYFLEVCAQSIYENRWISCAEKNIIENFCAYVDKNLYNNIDIKQTAASLYVSVSHLSRLIASEKGTTFTKYLTEKRIEAAKRLLITTNISVVELAAHLCFNEPGYFMKTFKRVTGMTCTEFRRKNKPYNHTFIIK